MMKFIFAASAALAAASASAQVGSVITEPTQAFNGPYIGIQGGWQDDEQRLALATTDGSFYRARDRTSGFAYGGQIGYDYRLSPHFVLGVEASATGRTGDGRSYDGYNNVYDLRVGRTFNGTGRLGYLVNPAGLVYVRGGYSNARFDTGNGTGYDAENRDGYTVGVGYEQAIARAVTARIEYNYSEYGTRNLYDAAFTNQGNVTGNYRRNAVTAGLNFHF
jgi:outer membrane immunogenic protein